jgi:hypothetical protein
MEIIRRFSREGATSGTSDTRHHPGDDEIKLAA